jgi:glutamyl-tRNA(Gln) amidotransferase subunit D
MRTMRNPIHTIEINNRKNPTRQKHEKTKTKRLGKQNKTTMKTKTLNPGDKVELKTKTKTWQGHALQSHDPEIILLKLTNGYNIGIRESEILSAKTLEKAKPVQKQINKSTNPKLPNIAMIITGGTISARLDPKTGGTTWTDKEELLNIAPELSTICNITKIESPFMKASEDMNYKDWKVLAEICETHLNDPSIDGIIITHGTDFIHYTSAALSYFIKNLNKPIAITYSQRSIDRASTDANLNLIAAAKFATSDIAEVALVGHETEEDTTCIAIQGKSARKMHSSKRDAFKPINDTPLARISINNFEILKTFNARNNNTPTIDTKFNEKIANIKITPGQNPDIIEFYKNKGYKGLILETTGLGHVPYEQGKHNWLPKIKSAIKDGMTIVATAQTIYGTLNPNVYSAGRDLQKTGIIFSNLTSETTLIKLGWVLGHKQWKKKEKMLEK